jgi:hypothetical protein
MKSTEVQTLVALRMRGAPVEAPGKTGPSPSPKDPRMFVLHPSDQAANPPTSTDPVDEAVQRVVARIDGGPLPLAPVLTSDVGVDRLATKDTGSPVSIISLNYFLQTATKQRPGGQMPYNWAESVHKRILPSAILLHSYGGAELPIVGQLSCKLTKGDSTVEGML